MLKAAVMDSGAKLGANVLGPRWRDVNSVKRIEAG
jgi:hypothetical protein